MPRSKKTSSTFSHPNRKSFAKLGIASADTASSGAEPMQQPGKPANPMLRLFHQLPMIRTPFRLFLAALLVPLLGLARAATPDGPEGDRLDSARLTKAVEGLKETEQELFLFERVERVEDRKSASDANPYQVKISRVFPAGTGIAHIQLGPDAAPADAAKYRTEMENLLNSLTWAAQSGKPQREAYDKVTKRQKERAELIDQTRFAFNFTYLGEEMRGDRKLLKFRMDPNPSYKPTSRSASLFTKVKGMVWLDEASGQMARIEGDVIDDMSFGIFLGKIYKGSHFMQERYEFAPGVWFPSFSQYDFDARKLFSQISVHQKMFASNYRRVGPPADAIPLVKAELERLGSVADNKNGAN